MIPTMRSDLKDLPIFMMDLPVDPERGFPVPWFVEWIDGKPEFRLMNAEKWVRAVKEKRCWVCGKPLGAFLCFVLGPMCGITRTTSEPPCHRACAQWSAKYCPFLSRPHMTRRGQEELDKRGATDMGGLALKRNPGVALLWVARSYKVFKPEGGGMLITVGEPTDWEWWAEGRAATRDEVMESIITGLPYLEAEAAKQEGAAEALKEQVTEFLTYLPGR
jgi:hypothetical protein